MLNQLEKLFAKSGALVSVLGIALLIASSGSARIPEQFGFAVAFLGVFLVGISFAVFRGSVYGYQKRIDAIAERSIDPTRFEMFVLLCWLAFVTLPFGVLLLKLTGIADGTNFYDFGAYYNAGERMVNGYPLYDWTTTYPGVTDLPNSPDRYLYAPIISLLFAPFTFLPYEISALAWASISTFVYISGITVFLRSFDTEMSLKEWLVIWSSALGFGPFVVTFISGQITAIVTGLLCISAASLHSENRYSSKNAGAILAIPVAVKAYYAPVCAPLLREKRRFFAGASAVTALIVASLVVFGIDTMVSYVELLANGKGWGEAVDPPKVWNINDFHPFYYFGNTGYVLRGVLLSMIAIVSYRSRQYGFKYVDLYVFSLGLLGIVLGAPTLATSGVIVLAPVILFLLVTTYRSRPAISVLVLISALLIHVHPYTTEFLTSVLLPGIQAQAIAAMLVPAVQPAVWGILLLLICIVYEFSRRIEFESAGSK